jgi:hypothetical protein
VEVLVDEGLEGMGRAFEILLNEAMKLARSDTQEGDADRSDGGAVPDVTSRPGPLRRGGPRCNRRPTAAGPVPRAPPPTVRIDGRSA